MSKKPQKIRFYLSILFVVLGTVGLGIGSMNTDYFLTSIAGYIFGFGLSTLSHYLVGDVDE